MPLRTSPVREAADSAGLRADTFAHAVLFSLILPASLAGWLCL